MHRLTFLFRDSTRDSAGDSDAGGPPPRDGLDALLRDWHAENADAARRDRAEILARASVRPVVGRISAWLGSPLLRAAAAISLAAMIVTMVLVPTRTAQADVVLVPEGGELVAFTPDGDRLGSCPLQRTDVDAEIGGPAMRVRLVQRYENRFPQKIEAVYTFPLPSRAAVDAMRITVRGPTGERIVDGEVKERDRARRMYEAAKASGYVASLLEQERPNIFTQSVANIEPGATVLVEISYVELLERRDGVYSFTFPTVVGPRYVPGTPGGAAPKLPAGLEPRAGLVLLAPGQATVADGGAPVTAAAIERWLAMATPVRTPTPEVLESAGAGGTPVEFTITYATGAKELGLVWPTAALGQLNGRFFAIVGAATATGFAPGTDEVPDASRITPMPVPPSERAGHDLSIRVAIETGGPELRDLASPMHEVVTSRDGRRAIVELAKRSSIPNRDFVLNWRTDSDLIGEGTLATVRTPRFDGDPAAGGHFAVILNPPARIEQASIPPRELVFVLDTSGSMSGFPIEKAKEVMSKAIAAMRPQDRFNVITFAGHTHILWPEPRAASEMNVAEARGFVDGQRGGGGTEMMAAIEAALDPKSGGSWLTPREMLDLPADGRAVRIEVGLDAVHDSTLVLDDRTVKLTLGVALPTVTDPASRAVRLEGRWVTRDGDRVLDVERASFARDQAANRICVFLTDGHVGNDQAIIAAVRRFARGTRVFSFGVGSSVNRYLLEEMARQGRGAAEFVFLGSDADATAERFARRIQTPVLVDLEASVEGVELVDTLPPLDRLPDLYDEQPIVIFGRFATPGRGSITLKGRTGAGPWEKTIRLDLPAAEAANAAVATLWARAKVDDLLDPFLDQLQSNSLDPAVRAAVVTLGESYSIVTPCTSFIAVERSRVTVGGMPMLVQVPIEMPEGVSWEGIFGEQPHLREIAARAYAAGGEAGDPPVEALSGDLGRALTASAPSDGSGSLGLEEFTSLRTLDEPHPAAVRFDRNQPVVVPPAAAITGSPAAPGGSGGGGGFGAGGGGVYGGISGAPGQDPGQPVARPTAVRRAEAGLKIAAARDVADSKLRSAHDGATDDASDMDEVIVMPSLAPQATAGSDAPDADAAPTDPWLDERLAAAEALRMETKYAEALLVVDEALTRFPLDPKAKAIEEQLRVTLESKGIVPVRRPGSPGELEQRSKRIRERAGQVLDPVLMLLAAIFERDPALSVEAAKAARPPVDVRDVDGVWFVRVTMLGAKDSAGVIEAALVRAGGRVIGSGAAGVIVAEIPMSALLSLALDRPVRKIEPFRAVADAPRTGSDR
jgi:hypothetical protein